MTDMVYKKDVLKILKYTLNEIITDPNTVKVDRTFVINQVIDALSDIKALDPHSLESWADEVANLYGTPSNHWATSIRRAFLPDGGNN